MARTYIRHELTALICGLATTGCLFQEEPAPKIVVRSAATEEVWLQSVVRDPPRLAEPAAAAVPEEWLPASHPERRWTAVILHHSATPTGNAAIFDRWHREENLWDGVGYDFVIGNGSDSADGAVEVTFRWSQQRTGAHTGGTPGNWANEEAIGICLVGDFSVSHPTPAQMRSLAQLVQFLRRRYDIPISRIYGHGMTPGARPTDCPGGNFPVEALKESLEK